jgi:hypothetical protein
MHCPIMLWMTSRSRSSMVAAIFAAHGVHWGEVQQQSAGYDTFENQKVKGILKKHFGLPFCTFPESKQDALTEIFGVVPHDRVWMMKTGVEYFKVFQPLTPFNVFIVRDPKAVAKSLCDKNPGARREVALEAAEWRFQQMRILHQQNGGVWVDTDRVIAGDLTQIREALEYCGILYDEAKTKRAIHK